MLLTDDNPPLRDKLGRFPKGVSGNPNGKPTIEPQVREALKLALPEAIRTLVALMKSEDEDIRIRACESIINRNLGKPAQSVEVTGVDGSDLFPAITINVKSPKNLESKPDPINVTIPALDVVTNSISQSIATSLESDQESESNE